jgi:hypothetical protein
MLGIILLSVDILSVIIKGVIMLSVYFSNAVMLNVTAPFKKLHNNRHFFLANFTLIEVKLNKAQ